MKTSRIITVGLICMMMAGCGESSKTVQKSAKDLNAISSSLLELYDADEMEEQNDDTVRKLLAVDDKEAADLNAWFGKENPDDVLIVIESSDEDSAMKANDALNYYLDSLKNSASLYSKDQLEQLNNAYISTKGVYSVMVIDDDADEAKKAAVKALN